VTSKLFYKRKDLVLGLRFIWMSHPKGLGRTAGRQWYWLNHTIRKKFYRKYFRSANGCVVLVNSSLANSARPGMEISLVTLRNLLVKRLGNHQQIFLFIDHYW